MRKASASARLLVLAAGITALAVAMGWLQPLSATPSNNRSKGVAAAKQLSADPSVKKHFPELADFGRAISVGRLEQAKRIGDAMIADPGRLQGQVKALMSAKPAKKGAGPMLGLIALPAVGVSPQIDVGALIRQIICPILAALAAAFGPILGAIINALNSAFGCNPTPSTSTPSSSSSTSSSTSSSSSTSTTVNTVP